MLLRRTWLKLLLLNAVVSIKAIEYAQGKMADFLKGEQEESKKIEEMTEEEKKAHQT